MIEALALAWMVIVAIAIVYGLVWLFLNQPEPPYRADEPVNMPEPTQIRINGKPYTRGFLGRTGPAAEAEAIMEASAMVESQSTGRHRWATAEIILTDENCANWDVASHANWLMREADQVRVRVVDKRTKRGTQ